MTATPLILKIRKTFLWCLQSFTIDACDHDEGHHLSIVTSGVKASRHHNHIKELRWSHANNDRLNLKRKHQEIIAKPLESVCDCTNKQSSACYAVRQWKLNSFPSKHRLK